VHRFTRGERRAPRHPWVLRDASPCETAARAPHRPATPGPSPILDSAAPRARQTRSAAFFRMVLAMPGADHARPKRPEQRPHRRRATVDASCLARPRPRLVRRPSLPSLRSVRFSEFSQVCVFRGAAPRPPAADRWYTRADHARFKRDRVAEVRAFRGERADDAAEKRCPVGVEQFLSAAALLAAHGDKRRVLRGVLREQHRQRASGLRDPERLAHLAAALSQAAARGALRRGKFQEMAKFVE